MLSAKESALLADFQVLDTGQTGYIDASQLTDLLAKSAGRSPSSAEVASVRAELADSNGRVSCESYIQWIYPDRDSKSSREHGENKALSVHYLSTQFVREVETSGPYSVAWQEATIRDIEDNVICAKGKTVWCNRHNMEGASYVDSVDDAHVGHATHMLSYTWSYKVSDIVSTLAQFCVDKPREQAETFVWMCCVCVNQHFVRAERAKGQEVSFDTLSTIFEQRIRSIGSVLVLVAPWRSPENLTRVWWCAPSCLQPQTHILPLACTLI